MKRTIILLVLLFLGCSSAPLAYTEHELDYGDVVVVAPELMGNPEVDAAFAEWDHATGGSARFLLVSSPRDAAWRLGWATFERGMGRTLREQRAIELNLASEWPEDWARRVMLHELGHAMRLEHGDGSLMEPAVGSCIDESSLTVLCEMRGCAERRPTCE